MNFEKVRHNLKIFFKKYGYGFVSIYYIFCLALYGIFNALIKPVFIINTFFIDKFIPFCEIFVIPYVLWYAYIFFAFLLFFIFSRKQFLTFCLYTFIGVTISYMIYFILPNGIGDWNETYNGQPGLRPDFSTTEKIEESGIGRDNVFIRGIGLINSVDNNNNVCPSLHCYNSLVISIVLMKSRLFDKRKWIVAGSWILTAMISMSTLFIKQHSIIDLFAAAALAAVIYPVVYKIKWKFLDREDVDLKTLIKRKDQNLKTKGKLL